MTSYNAGLPTVSASAGGAAPSRVEAPMIGSASVAVGSDHVGVTGATTGIARAVPRTHARAGARGTGAALCRVEENFSKI